MSKEVLNISGLEFYILFISMSLGQAMKRLLAQFSAPALTLTSLELGADQGICRFGVLLQKSMENQESRTDILGSIVTG